MSSEKAENSKNGKHFALNFLMGGISAGISKTVVAPLERIKIVLQTQDANDKIRSGEAKKYKGVFGGIKNIYQNEGLISLWRGNLVNVIRYIPTQAFNLAFMDVNKKLFKKYDPKTEKLLFTLSYIISGGLAGGQSQIFVYPFDFARTRLAADIGSSKTREFHSLQDLFTKIYKSEGIRGFYRGFCISLSFAFVYRGAHLGLYYSVKEMHFSQSNIFAKFLVAQAVTALAGTIVYPIDTIRRRLMMQSGKSQVQYTSSLDCIRKIHAEEGMNAFFKGGLSNIYRGMGGALVLVIYDELRLAFAHKY